MTGFPALLFWMLGGVLLCSAAACVSVRNPVHAALCLILAFFNAALLWLLLRAEFLGVLLVLVYIGAVLLLFLFVVMMLGRDSDAPRSRASYRLPALALAGALAGELAAVFLALQTDAAPATGDADASNTEELGAVLYTEHVLAFEMAAVLLLIAIVAAVALTLGARSQARRQQTAHQVQTRKEDRLRLRDGTEEI